MNGVIDPVFGKAIYSNQLDIDAKKIVSMIDNPRKSYIPYDDSDYRFQDVDEKSLHVLEEDKFKFLKDIILKEFYSYAYDGMRFTNKFRITTSWFTKIVSGEGCQLHNHLNCFMSGLLYLQTPPNCGDIVLQDFDDKRFNLMPIEFNVLNSREWIYTPKEGLILFFPGEIYHKVEVNKSEQTRYSLAFNIIPTGLIGDETSDSHLII